MSHPRVSCISAGSEGTPDPLFAAIQEQPGSTPDSATSRWLRGISKPVLCGHLRAVVSHPKTQLSPDQPRGNYCKCPSQHLCSSLSPTLAASGLFPSPGIRSCLGAAEPHPRISCISGAQTLFPARLGRAGCVRPYRASPQATCAGTPLTLGQREEPGIWVSSPTRSPCRSRAGRKPRHPAPSSTQLQSHRPHSGGREPRHPPQGREPRHLPPPTSPILIQGLGRDPRHLGRVPLTWSGMC